MRHENLRFFLEMRRYNQCRDFLFHGGKGLDHVAAHVKFDFAGCQKQAIIGLGAALQNRHIQPVFGECAIGHGLIIAAVLGLGQPVGGKSDLVGCGSADAGNEHDRDRQAGNCATKHLVVSPGVPVPQKPAWRFQSKCRAACPSWLQAQGLRAHNMRVHYLRAKALR